MSNPELRECHTEAEMKAFLRMTQYYRIMSKNRLLEETGCQEPCNEVLSEIINVNANVLFTYILSGHISS